MRKGVFFTRFGNLRYPAPIPTAARFRLEGAPRHTVGLIEHIILKGTLLTGELKQLRNTSENFPKGFRP